MLNLVVRKETARSQKVKICHTQLYNQLYLLIHADFKLALLEGIQKATAFVQRPSFSF